jgi:hypothetical protein
LRQSGFGVDYHVDTVFSLDKSFRYAQPTYETHIAGEKTVEALASIDGRYSERAIWAFSIEGKELPLGIAPHGSPATTGYRGRAANHVAITFVSSDESQRIQQGPLFPRLKLDG